MSHPFLNAEIINAHEAEEVTGGLSLALLSPTESILTDPIPFVRPQDPPREYTQALGEGGGHLPDIY